MIQIISLFINVASAFAAPPKFHCYTYPNSAVAAYQTPVKCGDGNQMEIVCTYSAGCKPTEDFGEPPEKQPNELAIMLTSGELKGSFLICKGKGEIKDGQIGKVECPSPTKCRGDGLFNGVIAGGVFKADRVSAPMPQPGAPSETNR